MEAPAEKSVMGDDYDSMKAGKGLWLDTLMKRVSADEIRPLASPGPGLDEDSGDESFEGD